MRFLILDTGYPAFLASLYREHPGLAGESYAAQAEVRADSMFGQAPFFAANLRELGHEAWDVEANNEPLQRAWAREHGVRASRSRRWSARLRRGFFPWISLVDDKRWLYEILAEQIKHYRPDVLLNYAMELDGRFFHEIKPHVRLLVGHHAAPLPAHNDFSAYDLTLSLVDNFVDYFRQQGLRSERFRQGFEPRVLSRLNTADAAIGVSFVGNLHHAHASRLQWLTHVCERVPVDVWTGSPERLPEDSPIRRRHRGAAWGMEMYGVLHNSRMTLNHHVDVAGRYAGNIRLFEATGVGTLLVTDWKQNLHEIFDVGREVVSYRSPEECVELLEYYLAHDDERQEIARAGQQRVFREHTYRHRMQELVGIVQPWV